MLSKKSNYYSIKVFQPIKRIVTGSRNNYKEIGA